MAENSRICFLFFTVHSNLLGSSGNVVSTLAFYNCSLNHMKFSKNIQSKAPEVLSRIILHEKKKRLYRDGLTPRLISRLITMCSINNYESLPSAHNIFD